MAYTTKLLVEVAGAKDVQNQFRQVGTSMQQVQGTTGQLNQSLQGTSQSLTNTGKAVGGTSKGMDQYNKSTQQVVKSTTDVTKAHVSMGTKIQNSATGFALAGSAAVSLWNAYDNVGDSAKKVEISENKVNQTELRLSKAREALNKLQASGTASALDLQQAQQQVAVASGNVERAEFNLTNAQEALNEAWLNAATSIVPALFSGISGLGMIINAFKGTQAAASAATDLSTGSLAANALAADTSAISNAAAGAAAATAAPEQGELAIAAAGAATALTALVSTLVPTVPAEVAAGGAAAVAAPEIAAMGGAAGAAAPEMEALSVSSAGLAVPLAVVAAAFVGLAALAVVVERNLFGVGDAFKGFADWIHNLTAAFPGVQQAFDKFVGGIVWLRQNFVGLLEQIPFIGGYIKNLGKDTQGAVDPTTDLGTEAAVVTNQFDKMSPSVQQLAKDLGLYGDAALQASAKGKSLTEGLQAIQDKQDSGIKSAREFAMAQGVPLMKAFSMSGDALLNFAFSLDNVKEKEKSAAETAKEESKNFADAWMKGFDDTVSKMNAWGSTMDSAFKKIGGDMGEELKGIGTDIKDKFSKGVEFTNEFWDKAFPEGLASEAMEKSFNLQDVIDDTRHFLKKAVSKGLITKEDAKQGFEPFLTALEGLPDNLKKSFGLINATMPNLMENFRETVVGGIKIAPAVKQAINQNIVQPILKTLDKGGGLAVGGPTLVATVKGFLPQLEGINPDVAAALKVAIYDPFNNMAERDMPTAVQNIIATLDGVSPGVKDMIFGIDKDTDKTADIIDTNMIKPMDEMRLMILETAADIALALGNTTAYNLLQGKIQEITAGFNELGASAADLPTSFGGFTKTINGLASYVWKALTPLQQMIYKVDGELPEGFTKSTISGDALNELVKRSVSPAQKLANENLHLATNAAMAAESANNAAAGIKTLGDNAVNTVGQLASVTKAIDDFIATGDPTSDIDSRLGETDADFMKGVVQPSGGASPLDPLVQSIKDGVAALPGQIAQFFKDTDWGAVGKAASDAIVDSSKWLYTAFTTGFLPIVNEAVTGLYNIISGYLGSVDWGAVGLQAQNAIVDSAKWLYDVFANKLVPFAASGIAYLTTVIGNYFASVDWGAAFKSTQDAMVDSFKWLGGIFTDEKLGPYLSLAAGGLVGLLVYYLGKTDWSTIQSTISSALTTTVAPAIGTTLGNLGAWILKGIADGTTDLPQKLTGAGTTIWNAIAGIFSDPAATSKAITDIPASIKTTIDGIDWAGIGTSLTTAFGDAFVKEGGPAALNKIIGNVDSLLSWIRDGLNALPAYVGAGLKTIAGDFGSYIQSGFNNLVSSAGSFLTDAIIGKSNSMLNWLNKGIAGLPKAIGDSIASLTPADIMNGITTLFGKLGNPTAAFKNWFDSVHGETTKTSMSGPGGSGFQQVGFQTGGGQKGDINGTPTLGASGSASTGGLGGGGDQFAALKQAYTDFQTFVGTTLSTIATYWKESTDWLAALFSGEYLDALTTGADQYVNFQTGVGLILSSIAEYWKASVDWLGELIGGQHLEVLTGLANQYLNIQAGVAKIMDDGLKTPWDSYLGYLDEVISGAHMGYLTNLANQYINIRDGIRIVLGQSAQAWNVFSNVVSQASSRGIQSMSALAGATTSNMRSVVQAVSQATSAIRTLSSAINGLHGKDITITTHYKTVGSPGGGIQRAQHGMEPSIIDHPTNLVVGEAGPELVSVTPLSAGAGDMMGHSIATGMLRAAKGAHAIAGADKKRMLYEGDIRYFLDKHGMKLEQFTDLDKKGKILISAMRRGDKPAISRSEWKDFAHHYGLKLHDIDKKKGGIYEIELSGGKKKLKMNLGRGFAGPGLGLDATGFAPQGGFADSGISFDSPLGGNVTGALSPSPTRSGGITRNLSAATGGSNGGGGGDSDGKTIELTVNVTVPLDSEVVGKAASKHVFTNVSGY